MGLFWPTWVGRNLSGYDPTLRHRGLHLFHDCAIHWRANDRQQPQTLQGGQVRDADIRRVRQPQAQCVQASEWRQVLQPSIGDFAEVQVKGFEIGQRPQRCEAGIGN